MSRPLIALDFSTLDHLSLLNGQYRYCLDLVCGLARLRPAADFVLLGSWPDLVTEIRDVIRDQQGQWAYCQLSHHRGRGRYWRDQLRYTQALRRLHPSLYHSLDGFVPLTSPCPVVTTQYDLMVELFPEYNKVRAAAGYHLNRWATRRLVRRTICISETTASDLRHIWRVARERIDVVMLGTDYLSYVREDRVSARRPEIGLSAESWPIILSPYNLEPRKNLISLLQAAASLRTRYPRLLLVLYGRAAITPERETAFESRARELGLDGAFERTGALDDRVLRQLYQQCTLFVFPSLYEGFGLPLLEAMACSACVVARSASAMAEVVGDAGTLVETRDPDVLADSIRKLLDNPLKCEELRTAALHRARLFTIDRMAGLTYRSYCTALDIKNDDAPLP
jgi:glycosyltransferase involved in cell wall biosynthesis